MYRRALLAALCGLSGCTGAVPNPFGGDSGSNGGSSGNGGGGSSSTGDGDASTETVTATASSDPSATPTATETPSVDDLQGMSVPDLLAVARDQIAAAITVYTGEGDELTDVTARSSSFDSAQVVMPLFHARRAYEAANRQGISADEEATIRALRQIDTALRHLIDLQVLLIEAHDDLEAVVTAIEFVDAETVSSLTARITNRQERAVTTTAALSRSQYELAAGSLGVISKAAFVEKRQQLITETSVLGDIVEAFPTILTGVRQFARAQGAQSSGSPYTAATMSRDAAADLGRGAATLQTTLDSIPPRGRSFRPIATELVSATTTKREEARAFADSIEL